MTLTNTTLHAVATKFVTAFFLATAFCSVHSTPLSANENLSKRTSSEAVPMIVAHRGSSYSAPENTISAFNLAWEQGADAVEGDFYLSADGEIVCLHDKTTSRTAPGSPSLKVSDATLEQLRKLDVGSWKHERYAGEKIPTLTEVLATVPEGKGIFVEIKCGPEILPALQEQLAKSSLNPEQITIICFNEEVVRQARAMMPYDANWLTSYKKQLTGGYRPSQKSVIDSLQSTNATGFGTQVKPELLSSFMTQDFCDAIRESGCGMHGWTINDPEVAKQLVDRGFLSITTDRPKLIRESLSN